MYLLPAPKVAVAAVIVEAVIDVVYTFSVSNSNGGYMLVTIEL